jgi:K+ transporter
MGCPARQCFCRPAQRSARIASAQHQAQPRAAPAQYCARDRYRPHTVCPKKARVAIKDLSHGFFRIIAHFGFMETPTIGEVIQSYALKDFVIEEHKTSFFLGRATIIPTGKSRMARWREHLFVAMSHHAQRPAEFFKLLLAVP